MESLPVDDVLYITTQVSNAYELASVQIFLNYIYLIVKLFFIFRLNMQKMTDHLLKCIVLNVI